MQRLSPQRCVSVVMPARNAAATIGEALRSILVQPEVLEVIVVDDKSTDRTRAVLSALQDARIVVVEGEGRGIGRALNLAIAHAQGEFVARCDSDDRYPVGRLEWQTAFLRQHADYVAVCGGFRSISKQGRPVAKLACDGVARDITDSLRSGASVTHLCTFLIRRLSLIEMGGAREWFTTAEDIDLMFRLSSIGRIWHDPLVAYDYRLHDASIVHTQSDVQRLFFERAAIAFAVERRDAGTDALERGAPPVVPLPAGRSTKAGPQIAGHLEAEAWAAFRQGSRWRGIRLVGRSIINAPTRISSWRSLALMFVRPTGSG